MSANVYGQIAFSPGIRYPAGFDPSSIVVADVNGDDKPDVIVANRLGGSLSVFTNQGNGDFTLSSNITVCSPTVVVASDVNGDGKMDLICADEGCNMLTVLTNKGNGTFALASTPAAGTRPESLIAVDVNSDGKPDLIAGNYSSAEGNTLSVLTNDGTGNFAPAYTLPVNGVPYSLAAADVNEDGKLDLISAGGYVTILTNSASSASTNGPTFIISSSPYFAAGAEKIAAADVNGDGYIDLVTANTADDTLSIFTNDGRGNFTLTSSPSVPGGPASLAVADVNGDGKVDLVVGTIYGNIYTDTGLTVLTNDGAGNFTTATKFRAAAPDAVTVADVNGDGKADLVSNEWLNRFAVFFQVPQLSATLQAGNILVSWPASWTNWGLEANADLSSTNWVSRNDISNDGTSLSVTVPVSGTNLFFRSLPPVP